MKYGIFYAYWVSEWGGDYLPYVKKVADLGFDILEIGGQSLNEYSEEQIRNLRSCCGEQGIELTVGYGPAYEHNIGTADRAARDRALDWYKSLFEAMEKLNSRRLAGPLYSYWPVDYSAGVDKEKDWANSVEGLKLLGEAADRHGISLGLEVLNRFESHILNTAEEAADFVRQVGRDNVKIMLDTFHMNIEEESIGQAIRTAGKYLGHFHVGECNRMVPGKGRIPWREIGEALREIEYDGPVVMEPFVKKGGAVGRDIKIWHDIIADPSEARLDEDARDAVRFLRYMFE